MRQGSAVTAEPQRARVLAGSSLVARLAPLGDVFDARAGGRVVEVQREPRHVHVFGAVAAEHRQQVDAELPVRAE